MQFVKRNIHIAGRTIPALQVSPSETTMVDLPSGKRIPGQFADLLSLRETNPDGPNPGQTYLTTTRENLRFTTLRFENVPGLDYDPETGAILTIEELELRRAADIEARQVANLANRSTVVALDAEVEADA